MDKLVIQQRRRSYLRFLCIYGIVKYVFYENRLLFNIDILSFDWVFFCISSVAMCATRLLDKIS